MISTKSRSIRVREARGLLATTASILLAVGLLSACSSGDAGTAPATGAAKAADTKVYAPGVPSLAELRKGTFTEPPSSGPAAKKGVRIAWVSCGQASAGCRAPADFGTEAAQAAGWTYKIFDGALTTAGQQNATEAAIAWGPDAIVISGIDCPTIVTALQEAKAKGIVTIGTGLDCDSSIYGAQASQPLFTAHIVYNDKANDTQTWDKLYGAAQASYVIDATKGKAKVITLPYNTGFGLPIEQGWRETFAKCSGCQIVDSVPWVTADQTTSLPGKIATVLAKHPDANALLMPFDSIAITAQAAQQVVNAGLNGKIVSVTGEGTPDALTLIKDNRGLTAAAAVLSYEWRTWATFDELNRALQNKPLVAQGLGFEAVDNSNINSYAKAVPDFKAAYKKIWNG